VAVSQDTADEQAGRAACWARDWIGYEEGGVEWGNKGTCGLGPVEKDLGKTQAQFT
jgi:hypothetical protein